MVNRVNPDQRDLGDSRVKMDRKALKDPQGLMGCVETRGKMVCQVLTDSRVILGIQVQLAPPGHRALQVTNALAAMKM